MKNMRFGRYEAKAESQEGTATRQQSPVTCVNVLQIWGQHREYLLRNKLRIF